MSLKGCGMEEAGGAGAVVVPGATVFGRSSPAAAEKALAGAGEMRAGAKAMDPPPMSTSTVGVSHEAPALTVPVSSEPAAPQSARPPDVASFTQGPLAPGAAGGTGPATTRRVTSAPPNCPGMPFGG
jgi:hypothetical protein